MLLINLLGAGALLLWGLRMVRTGVMRCWGGELRRRLGESLRNRFSALFAGLSVTLLLQSSTATTLMAASFADRGLLTTAGALDILLGADIGTSLLAQILSFRIAWLPAVLIFGGVALFFGARRTQPRDLGRTIIGLGIILLALRLVGEAAEPMRESPVLAVVLGGLDGAPVLAVILAAALTVLSTSSLAVVLFVVTLVTAGVVHLPLGFALVLGANLGSGLIPLVATAGSEPEGRRVAVGNLLFRGAGVALALPLLGLAAPAMAWLEASPARQVVDFHVAFNLALVALFMGLVGPVGRLCDRLLPSRAKPEDPGTARYLDPDAAVSPSAAIANAARETLRMGDLVERMLHDSLRVFRTDDRNLLREVERLDDAVDSLHEAVKLYLTDLRREGFDKEDNRRLIEVLTFTTNLEHIGDIIDKNLMELAAKKIRHKLRFSDEGFAEITAVYGRLFDNFRLALNLFISGDVKMARQLVREKVILRDLERAAFENHLRRLHQGVPETIETSSLHLDVLRDLRRINSHLASVAYPILDAAGELVRSRLKEVEPLPEPAADAGDGAPRDDAARRARASEAS
ncbi:MAG: Na/Pi cotransporter family protein [Rhodospirillaceae bacterium]|nr:Na/Pi cotransporter family protein [Rhodospirillaceae bacterium]